MFRWSYIVPRLLIVLAIVLAVRFGTNPLVKYVLQRTGESALGSRVEIATVKSSLLDGDLYLADVQIADPRDPSKNLVQAEHALLNLDRDALMRRKYVVTEGKMTGLRFGVDRDSDGSLTGGPDVAVGEENESDLGDQFREMGEEWLDGFVEQLESDVRDEFETVRVTEDLMRRWPAEYEQLDRDINNWQVRIDNLKKVYEEMRRNPLRSVDYYQKRLGDLASLQQEIVRIRGEAGRLTKQVATDRAAVAQAKKNDEAKIREALKLENLDPETLSNYLLGEEVVQQVSTTIEWVERGRSMLGIATAKPDDIERGRGRIIDFDREQRPDVLIHTLAFDGLAAHKAKDVAFKGVLRELTTQPKLHGQPTLLTLETRGSVAMTMQATLDRTGEQAIDNFQVNVPTLPRQQRALGNTEKLALNVGSGTMTVNVALKIIDDQCDGTITLQQNDVQLRSIVSDKLGGQRVAQRIDSALSNVRTVGTTVHVSGDLKRPSVKLNSSLGPALASGINAAVQQEIAYRGQQLAGNVDTKLDQQVAKFETFIQQQQHTLAGKLQLNEQEISDFKTLMAQRFGVSGAQAFSAQRILEDKGDSLKNLFLK